ncbi:CDF family Co(II)/Ni(II) efflux transporter DmeF [Aurantivibrio plasticivorans]
MKDLNLAPWQHDHSFQQDQKRPGEHKTLIVIAMTAIMMVIEVVAGLVFGSMALLADGLHMASHTVALGITYFAYWYARKHAHNPRYSFGTGKVNTLGGYTGAILLAGFALMMIWESAHRLIEPVPISFNQAIAVAVVGLVVNGLSVWVLGVHSHDHDDHHSHNHSHNHNHAHAHQHNHDHAHHHEDHNLKSAYLHVMADALTSVLAIVALVIGKYFGATWLDPIMGLVGAALVARWSWGLLKSTSAILLDEQASEASRRAVRDAIEDDQTRVTDLHLWAVGPNIYCGLVSVVSTSPKTPLDYRGLIPAHINIEHITIEVHTLNNN